MTFVLMTLDGSIWPCRAPAVENMKKTCLVESGMVSSRFGHEPV